MHGLVQPSHVLFALLIVLIQLAARTRSHFRHRVECVSEHRRPTQTMTPTVRRWIKYLLAVLFGNIIYFGASPHLPPAARDAAGHFGLATLVDLWFCLFAYGLIELGALIGSRLGPRPRDK